MPSIKNRTGLNLQGFEPVDNPALARPSSVYTASKANPMIRTPIPPLGADPDSLRQFDESGPIPTRRVIPLPLTSSSVSGGASTVITNIVSPSQTGGGGSSTTPATLTLASLTLNVPALASGQAFVTSVTMAKSFQLLQLISTQPLEYRIYGSSIGQGADIARATDIAPPYETTSGIITDVVLDTIPYKWAWQNRIGANADSTQTSTVYITVINPSVGTHAATMTLIYLPLLS